MVDKGVSPSHLTWNKLPELKAPFLVMGFHGWSNAGNISSDTLLYLIEALKTDVLATLCEEPFINYTIDRPVAQIEDGIIYDLDPMVSELSCWINADGEHDLLLFLGKEPHLSWRAYSEMILDIMRQLGVQMLYTIGGGQDTVSHSGPPLVTVVGSSPSVVAGTIRLDRGIRAAEYYGPVSIHSNLVKACMDAGFEAATLWGHVPAYLQKSPQLVEKLISILGQATGLHCCVEQLRQKSLELERKIDEALSKDPDLRQFVETIEKKQSFRSTSSRDDKIIHLNNFVRRETPKDPES
jgi:proteasome assembly chaperone (PAC2) family protein